MIFLDSEAESLLGGVFDNCGAETVADTQDATPAPSDKIENFPSSPKLQVMNLVGNLDDGNYSYCILIVNIF